ncbi:MAG TPA: hypothetical protein VHC22_32635 [Pirellulales bacterium]|nr:hypothetical protein [Pirellulales bacterium]
MWRSRFASCVCSFALAATCWQIYAARAADVQPVQPMTVGGEGEERGAAERQAASQADLPAERPRYVLLTDAELRRVNLAALFAGENPDAWQASGGAGIDFAAYFGLQSCVAKSAGGLSVTKRMGWLAPEAFVAKFAKELQGDAGWDRLPPDAPKPEWLKGK